MESLKGFLLYEVREENVVVCALTLWRALRQIVVSVSVPVLVPGDREFVTIAMDE